MSAAAHVRVGDHVLVPAVGTQMADWTVQVVAFACYDSLSFP